MTPPPFPLYRLQSVGLPHSDPANWVEVGRYESTGDLLRAMAEQATLHPDCDLVTFDACTETAVRFGDSEIEYYLTGPGCGAFGNGTGPVLPSKMRR